MPQTHSVMKTHVCFYYIKSFTLHKLSQRKVESTFQRRKKVCVAFAYITCGTLTAIILEAETLTCRVPLDHNDIYSTHTQDPLLWKIICFSKQIKTRQRDTEGDKFIENAILLYNSCTTRDKGHLYCRQSS